MMGCGINGSFGWLGMGLGMIIHLAFAALIIMAAVWLFKALFQGGNQGKKTAGPLDILKERYAKGEITAEDYQRLKREIE